MRYLIIITMMLTLFGTTGCDSVSAGNAFTKRLKKTRILTCKLNNFRGFPRIIKAPLSFELRSYYIVKLHNRNNTQIIEISFHKKDCK